MSAGTDLVNDFTSGTDKIDVGSGLTYTLTDVGADLRITASNGNVMLLSGINKAGFNESTDLVDNSTHEFTVEYLEDSSWDCRSQWRWIKQIQGQPHVSGYVDGDDYLVTGTLVGA